MLISGYSYRSIFEQTGLSFDLNLSINNVTGSGAFGFSGEGNKIQFTFQSGKVFDFENRYVHSYLANTNFKISGDLENVNYSYYINNIPLCFNGIKNNFKVDNFFYNASNCILDTDLKINSANPAIYNFVLPENFKAGKLYTGFILNNQTNLAFKIFSGSLTPTGQFSINGINSIVSGLKSGQIVLNTVNDVGGYNLTLNLFTNFGKIDQTINITGLYNIEDIVTLFTNPDGLLLSGQREVLNEGYMNLTYSKQVTSGEIVLTGYNNLPLEIKFQYFSGATGDTLGLLTGTGYGYNLLGTGRITEADLGSRDFNFTGLALISGYNFRNNLYTDTVLVTGVRNVTATGIFNYPDLTYTASGFITGFATGYFFYTQRFTGEGASQATGFNTSWWTGYLTGTGFVFYRDGATMNVNPPDNPFYLVESITGFMSGYLREDLNYRLITGDVLLPTGYPTIAYFSEYNGNASFILITGSGIITGAETLVRQSGRWNVTGVFTGDLTGYIDSTEYQSQSLVIGNGYLSGLAYASTSISGDPFSWTGIFTGEIQINQSTATQLTGILATGKLFSSNGIFNVTGINITGSKIISGLYTGLQSGDINQIDSDGTILINQLIFITSGNYQNVTGNLGVTEFGQPLKYATGIYNFTTGDILVTGFIPNVPIYEKSFSGSFDILTGVFDTGINDVAYTGLYYNKAITGYSGSFMYDTGTLFNIRFNYQSFLDYSGMIGKLTLSGTGNTIYTTYITGV